LQDWQEQITNHTSVHEKTKDFMRCFHPDAHPMGILVSTLAALSTIYHEPGDIVDPQTRRLQIVRLIAKVPTIAAYLYRHSLGYPFVYPDNRLSYTENFMHMPWSTVEPRYVGNPVLARALDVLFILHADHEQNCSANAMRCVGSSHAGPYLAAAAAALAGPLHGGASRVRQEPKNTN
jgi:citrate synthase